MTDAEMLDLIERDVLWIHPTGPKYPGGWNIDNTKGRWVWNKPTLRGAIEAYKRTEPVEGHESDLLRR